MPYQNTLYCRSIFLAMRPNRNMSRHSPVAHGGVYSIKGISEDILDFSSNINPLGLMPKVRKEIRKNLDLLQIYPDSESRLLRRTLESYTGIPSPQIVVGNGATEIVYNFCSAFLSSSTPVLIPAPTFGEYEAAAKLAGARTLFFKTMNLEDDLAAFLSKLPKNGCVFVCNPNNPTGTMVSKNGLKIIVQEAKRRNTLVFVDECFIELVPDRDESVMHLVRKHENLFILRSLTKSFALAGMRLGYGLGSNPVVSILNKTKIPWNVSGLAQNAARIALSDLSYLEKARKLIGSEAEFLRREISKLDGFECHGTSTNFVLIKTTADSTLLQKRLLKKSILVRDCKSFRGLDGSFIRVAVKKRRENKKLIEALAAP